MEVQSERTARPFPLWRLHSGPQSWSVDQCPETPPEHLKSSVADAMRRSVVTHHRRRIKKIYHSMTGVIWLDRSLVRGPSFQISQARPSSGGCAIRHGSSMSPCTQGHRRSQTKGPASFGASSIRENRAAVLPAPRQNGGVRGRRRINAEGFRWFEPNGPPRRKRRNRTSLWPSKIGTRPGDVIKDARLGNPSRCGHCIPTQSYKLAPRRSDSRLLTRHAVPELNNHQISVQ